MHAAPLSDPFAPEWVVLGNKGLEDWLVRGIAQQVGVCAQVRFPFAMGFLHRSLACLEATAAGEPRAFDRDPPSDPWSPDAMAWAILDLLPGLLDDPSHAAAFAPVQAWMAAAPPAPPEAPTRRRYALARRVADVFDRVMVFRPELAVRWSARGADPDLPPDLRWQPILWRHLHTRLGPRHLAHRLADLPALVAQAALPSDLPQRVSVFGLSAVPPAVLRAYAQLGSVMDVELYLLNPSPHLWDFVGRAARLQSGDETVPNRLLSSFGRLARDFQHQLAELPEAVDDRTALVEHELWFDPAEAAPMRALSRLQSDVVHLRQQRHTLPLATHGADGRPVARDASLQVHACHGLTRQVEVLRDTLLGLLEDYADIEPRDILVLCPSMDDVAPLVSAVFDQGRDDGRGPPRIPTRIEDLSFRRTNPVAAALLAVLGLVDGRLEASGVLDLLAMEPVQLAFGIPAEQVPAMQALFQDAGARWGADGAWRARFDQPDDKRNTWRAALDRLALGAAMADDWQLWRGAAPHDDVEGGAAEIAGRAMAFAAAVLDEVARLSAPRTVESWMDTLLGTAEVPGTLDRMVRAPDNAGWLVERTRRELEGVRDQARVAGSTERVGLSTVRAHLEGRFEVVAPNPRTPGGAVTFAALRPMRGVPHAVVCLLGMDEGAFPRQADDLRFDPTARAPRRGDRDPRDEDRFAFLEAVLAARRHLVVLYTGKEPRTDQARPPCGPVAELLDVVGLSFGSVEDGPTTHHPGDWITRHHALQAFSPGRFRPEALPPIDAPGPRRAASFDAALCDAARSLSATAATRPFLPDRLPNPVDADPEGALSLDDLAAFWLRPIRWLLRHRLGLRLADDAFAMADREPQQVGGLERWQVTRDLTDAVDAGVSLDAAGAVLLARGGLPLGAPGRRFVADQCAVVSAALALEHTLKRGVPAEPVAIEVEVAGALLVGRIDRVWTEPGAESDGVAIERAIGRLRPGRLLAPWVRLLAWTACSAGASRVIHVVGVSDPPERVTLVVPGETDRERLDAARAHLARLVAGYLEGQARPLPIFERSSSAFAGAVVAALGLAATPDALAANTKITSAALQATRKAWYTPGRPGFDPFGEGLDLHFIRLFGRPDAWQPQLPWLTQDGLDPDFAAAALALWTPVFASQAEGATRFPLEQP